MSIKRIILVLAASLMFAGLASAQQQSKSDESLEFNPHWYIQPQIGAGATLGETSIWKMVSPAAFLNVGGEFSPVLGARFGVGGWSGKGYYCTSSTLYSFNFVQANADLMINFSNLVGGYKHDRVVSFYPFVGLGGYFGVKNGAQDLPSTSQDYMEYVWKPTKAMFLGRAGLMIDFRLSDCVSLNLEGNANGTSDHFNSKNGGNIDWQFNALFGVKINFGSTTRTSSAWLAAQAAAAEAAAAEAAARAAAEKAAAEAAARAAAEKAAAEAAARAAAEKAAAEAAAARAKVCEEQSVDVFFVIGKSYIRKAEKVKLDALCTFLKSNTDFTVELVGYADKQTGYPAYNQTLSERRASGVAKYLTDNGVPADRITTDAKGDSVQPYEKASQNRVVICTVE